MADRTLAAADRGPYAGDCIAHYLGLALYPPALTRGLQIAFGLLVVLANAAAYGFAWRRTARTDAQ